MVIIEILSRLRKKKSLNANLIIIKPKIYYLLLEEKEKHLLDPIRTLLYSDVILITTIISRACLLIIYFLSFICQRMTLRIHYIYDRVLYVYIFQRKYVCSQTTEPSRVNGKERETSMGVYMLWHQHILKREE